MLGCLGFVGCGWVRAFLLFVGVAFFLFFVFWFGFLFSGLKRLQVEVVGGSQGQCKAIKGKLRQSKAKEGR